MTKQFAMDIDRYVSRIECLKDVRPTLESLHGLQESHLLSVPFENLDILAGRRIALDARALFEKIVLKNRGGICYELNGLFYLLLKAIGFDAGLLMGRVYDRDRDAYGPPFDHMLIMAKVQGERWVVDVGFGDFTLHPLRFVLNQLIPDQHGRFVIEQYDDEYFRISRYVPEEDRYSPQYLFSLQERALSDFSEMCLYHQMSPDSHFTRQRVCSRATASGRITLTDQHLIVTEGGTRREVPLRDRSDFAETLAAQFNIVL